MDSTLGRERSTDPVQEIASLLRREHRGKLRRGKDGRPKIRHACLFHNDPEPSADFYIDDDPWYYCQACAHRFELEEVAAALGLEWMGAAMGPTIDFTEPDDAPLLPPAIPFPIEVLPSPVANYVRNLVAGGLSVDYCGTSTLPILAGALGSGASLPIHANWSETAIVWAINVGEQGSAKSAPPRELRKPLDVVQGRWDEQYDKEQEAYSALSRVEQKRQRQPQGKRVIVDDVTLESLAERMHENPAGVLWLKDELRALLHGLGQYKAGRSGDRAKFLELWTGAPIRIDRVKREGSIYVPRPFCCVVGGLQPSLLPILDADDGLRDRFLISWPIGFEPAPVDPGDDYGARQGWGELLRRLVDLRESQRRVVLSDGQRTRFLAEVKRIREESKLQGEPEAVQSFSRKAGTHLARLLLVLSESWHEYQRMATGMEVAAFEMREIFPGSIERAVSLMSYYIDQRRRMHLPSTNLMTPVSQRNKDQAVDVFVVWLESRPLKRATPRDIQRAHVAGVRTMDDVAALILRYMSQHPGRVILYKAGSQQRTMVYAPSRPPEKMST